MTLPISSRLARANPLAVGVFLMAAIYAVLTIRYGLHPLANNRHDSYALQALAWMNGRASLPADYYWLELARYSGHIFVSFPPVPTLVDFVTLSIFGGHALSNLLVMLYAVGSYAALFVLCRRLGSTPWQAFFWAFFAVVGNNLMTISSFGGVWFIAQLLCLLLTSLSLVCMTGTTRRSWALGLILFALAIGCRPFQAVFLPVYIILLYRNLGKPSLTAMAPYAVAPAAILLLMGWYNWLRFGSPTEFGHTFLPEFTRPGHPQFGLKYVLPNLFGHALRLPDVVAPFRLNVPVNDGFAFFLANPLYLSFAARLRGIRKADILVPLILALVGADFFVTLTHATMGGIQFGSRYTADVIPFMLLAILVARKTPGRLDAGLAAFGIALNLYGLAFLTRWLFGVS